MSETSVDLVPANPVAVLTDAKTYSEFYERVKAECDAFKPDLSTVTSRAKIAAQAYKVTRTKTAIDEAGKKLNEAARQQINAVDAQRRKIRDELDALAEDVRRPLTEWEKAEEDRKNRVRSDLQEFSQVCDVPGWEASQDVASRIARLAELRERLSRDDHLDGYDAVIDEIDKSAINLTATRDRLAKYEADQRELEKLRWEKEERERQEAAERERVAAEKEAKEAAERAEKEAKHREEEVAEKARQEEIRKAKEESERIAREAQAKIDAAEAEARRIKDEAERAEKVRQAEVKRIADEQEAREKDRAHRGAVMKAAKEAIMAHSDASEEVAKKIILAIVAGEIPNIKLTF